MSTRGVVAWGAALGVVVAACNVQSEHQHEDDCLQMSDGSQVIVDEHGGYTTTGGLATQRFGERYVGDSSHRLEDVEVAQTQLGFTVITRDGNGELNRQSHGQLGWETRAHHTRSLGEAVHDSFRSAGPDHRGFGLTVSL